MAASIVVMGPYLAGKSTIRRLLAERLGRPQASLNPFEDEPLCERYFGELGYDWVAARRAFEAAGHEGVYRHDKPYQAHAVGRCLAEHPGHVIELGAAFSVYEDERLRGAVRAALQPHHALLLLPSPDRDAAYRVLRGRYWALLDLPYFAEQHVRHPANGLLAKHTVYTEGQTPPQTRDGILRLLDTGDPTRATIVLIGPAGVGKSTVAELLSARLGRPQVALDVQKWAYYREAGYDEAAAGRIRREAGFRGLVRYCAPFAAHAVERALAEHPGCVLDCGAGHSVYEDAALFARVRRALAPFPNVFLLLPSPDPAASIRILLERPRSTLHGVDANRHFLEHPSNRELAGHIVYTAGRTPEQTCDEILRLGVR
jgi:deoxyadenosine/deoxycytidine kinase